MKESLISYIRRKFSRKENDEKVRSTHRAAQDYFGRESSNQLRADCPPRKLFEKIIGEKKLPDENLRSHLFKCSECFREYQAVLKQSKMPEKLASNAFFLPSKTLLAGSLAVVCLIALGMWFLKSGSTSPENVRETELAANNYAVQQSPDIAANADDLKTPPILSVENTTEANHQIVGQNQSKLSVGNKKRPPLNQIKPLILAKNETVEIDLNDQAVWRDAANQSESKIYQLNNVETPLRIKLAKENPAGVYEVFIADELGRKLAAKKTVRNRKRNLFVKIELRKITGRQNRLCVAPVGEIPDCVPIKLTSKKE